MTTKHTFDIPLVEYVVVSGLGESNPTSAGLGMSVPAVGRIGECYKFMKYSTIIIVSNNE